MEDADLYQTIAGALAKDSRILAAYVIGSTSRGQVGRESDFDLAVVVRDARSILQDDVYQQIRHIAFPRDLDLSVVDTHSSPLFLFQIIHSGTMIYETSCEERTQFEAYTLHVYYDTAHMRAIYAGYLSHQFARQPYAN